MDGKIICPVCKNPIPTNALFCPYCGNSIKLSKRRFFKAKLNKKYLLYVGVSAIVFILIIGLSIIYYKSDNLPHSANNLIQASSYPTIEVVPTEISPTGRIIYTSGSSGNQTLWLRDMRQPEPKPLISGSEVHGIGQDTYGGILYWQSQSVGGNFKLLLLRYIW
jgi:predicted nucleic acid-binding Zn ribbon protein